MFPIMVTDMPIKMCLMEINEKKKVLLYPVKSYKIFISEEIQYKRF